MVDGVLGVEVRASGSFSLLVRVKDKSCQSS